MYMFQTSDHHRQDDSESHDIFTLLAEIAILVVIMYLWPSG